METNIQLLRENVLGREFFERDAVIVARELLGATLVRKVRRKIFPARIVEVEAYEGFEDKASHASRGQTLRNRVMFGPPGFWYVYLCYGMHWMLNIVCGPPDHPAAVLIRGVEVGGLRINGPGRVTSAFGIDKKFNALPATQKSKLWIARGSPPISERDIQKTPRIGVAYAGEEWAGKPWRFVLKEK